MDYEKAYKAVLQTATQWIKDGCTDKEKICLESVFPELRESEIEDERIIKGLIKLLTVASEVYLVDSTGIKKDYYLAYLEKQKEPNAELMEKFNKGLEQAIMWGREGFKVSPNGEVKILNQDEIDDVIKKQKESLHIPETCKEKADSFTDGIIEVRSFQRGMEEGRRLEKQKEQKPPIAGNDFGWIDELKHDLEHPEELDEKVQEVLKKRQKPVEWTELTWKDIVELEGIINNVHYDFSAGIGQESFGKEVLERFRNKKDDAEVDACEQKPAEWSEVDEAMLDSIISIIEDWENEQSEKEKEYYGATSKSDWLKSLRPQIIDSAPLYTIEQVDEKVREAQEWSEDDEKMLNLTKTQLRILQSHLSHTHSERMSDMEYSSRLLQIEKCVSWLDIRLKSLRNQPKAELTLLDENIIKAAVAFVEQNDHFNCWGGIDKHTVIKALRSLKPRWKH